MTKKKSVLDLARAAKMASKHLARASSDAKDGALLAYARKLVRESDRILKANRRDLAAARRNGLGKAKQDRLRLTPERLEGLRVHLAPDVRFFDPFNDVTGIEAMVRVFAKMFEDLTDIAFETRDLACAEEDGVCYFAWTLRCRSGNRGNRLTFEGITELRFDVEGRVLAHLDHWDAGSQLYAKLPLLGFLVEKVRRRLSTG